jgi:hypothetical protein
MVTLARPWGFGVSERREAGYYRLGLRVAWITKNPMRGIVQITDEDLPLLED